MRWLLLLYPVVLSFGQTITVLAPANSTVIGEATAYNLTCSVSSIANLASVEYLVDGERAGIVKATEPSTCPLLPWNTYNVGNGSHLFTAVARDVKGNTLATSAANTASVENCLPQQASACSSTPSAANFGDIGVVTSFTGATLNVVVTATGPLAATAFTNDAQIIIDGIDTLAGAFSSTATSRTYHIDSSKYTNGAHTLFVRLDSTAGTLCPACASKGLWLQYGQVEQQITFSNSVVVAELRMTWQDVTLTIGSGVTCTATTVTCGTAALAGTDLNTDSTLTSATISSCGTPSPSGIATIALSGSGASTRCTWTPVAVGSTSTTVTDSNGLTRVTWAYVVTSNVMANMGDDGVVYNSFNASHSGLWNEQFQTGCVLNPYNCADSFYTQAQAATDFKAHGFHAAEAGLIGPAWGDSQATWRTNAQANVNSTCAAWTNNGLKIWLVSDTWTSDTPGPLLANNAPNQTWTPPGFQDYMQYFKNATGCVLGNSGRDEVAGPWGTLPNAQVIHIGDSGGNDITYNFTGPVNCTSDPCVVTFPGWQNANFQGTGKVLISGSGTCLDWSSTTNTPTIYTVTSIDANSFSFPRPAACTPGLVTTTNLALQQFAGKGGIVDSTGTVGGSTGPYGYVPGNIFNLFKNWSAGRVPISWPPSAPSHAATPNWSDPSVSQQAEMYTGASGRTQQQYLPTRNRLEDLRGSLGGQAIRAVIGYITGKPFVIKTEGLTADYTMQGWPGIALTACTGNTLTFAATHNTPNVIPWHTRLFVSGSSGAGCDQQLYAISTPTATTMSVALNTPDFTPGTDVTGTITWDDTSTATGVTMHFTNILLNNYFSDPGCVANQTVNKRGHTFTFSGAGYAGKTMIYWPGSLSGINTPCNTQQAFWAEIPNFSTTGGTGRIVRDDNFTWGRSWPGGNSIKGPIYPMLSHRYFKMLGATATRTYGPVNNPNGLDLNFTLYATPFSTNTRNLVYQFNGNCTVDCVAAVSMGVSAKYNSGGSVEDFYSIGLANLMTNRLAKWLLQPRLPSPDFGKCIETAARTDASNNAVLELINFCENTQTPVVTLSTYAIGGQGIPKYIQDWQGITTSTLSSGTVTDTPSLPVGATVDYIFDAAGSTLIQNTPISVRLADITSATGVLIEYAYGCASGGSPCYPFSSAQTDFLPRSSDCGSTFPCALAVDSGIGAIAYRIVYYDTNGKALARGDVQYF
jgi:hypothetical protein